MIVPIVKAKAFLGRAKSGRNRPPILQCLAGEDTFEFFVKLRNGKETSKSSLIFELLGAQLAERFGLKTPDPSIVLITREFCESLMDPQEREVLQKNIGANYGSKLLVGYGSSFSNERLTPAERFRAAEVFAFDALLQNPDRTRINPNLLIRGSDWRLIDHELAFSFSRDIGVSGWGKDALPRIMREHIFWGPLRGKEIALEKFEVRFHEITSRGDLNELFAELPRDWIAGDEDVLEKIENHFKEVRKNFGEFMELVKRILQ